MSATAVFDLKVQPSAANTPARAEVVGPLETAVGGLMVRMLGNLKVPWRQFFIQPSMNAALNAGGNQVGYVDERYIRYLSAFADEVRDLDIVSHVFYEARPDDLRLLVVFSGDRGVARPLIYDVEERLFADLGGLAADVRFIQVEQADLTSLKASLAQLT